MTEYVAALRAQQAAAATQKKKRLVKLRPNDDDDDGGLVIPTEEEEDGGDNNNNNLDDDGGAVGRSADAVMSDSSASSTPKRLHHDQDKKPLAKETKKEEKKEKKAHHKTHRKHKHKQRKAATSYIHEEAAEGLDEQDKETTGGGDDYQETKHQRRAAKFWAHNTDEQVLAMLPADELEDMRRRFVDQRGKDEPSDAEVIAEWRERNAMINRAAENEPGPIIAPFMQDADSRLARGQRALSAHMDEADAAQQHAEALFQSLEDENGLAPDQRAHRTQARALVALTLAASCYPSKQAHLMHTYQKQLEFMEDSTQMLLTVSNIATTGRAPRLGGITAWLQRVTPIARLVNDVLPQHYPGLAIPEAELELDPLNVGCKWFNRTRLDRASCDWVNGAQLAANKPLWVVRHGNSALETLALGEIATLEYMQKFTQLAMWRSYLDVLARSIFRVEEERPLAGIDTDARYAACLRVLRQSPVFVEAVQSVINAAYTMRNYNAVYMRIINYKQAPPPSAAGAAAAAAQRTQ